MKQAAQQYSLGDDAMKGTIAFALASAAAESKASDDKTAHIQIRCTEDLKNEAMVIVGRYGTTLTAFVTKCLQGLVDGHRSI